MEQQIQQDAWCSARTARVCQQCLYENCPQIIEKEQRPPNNSKFEYHGNIMSGE